MLHAITAICAAALILGQAIWGNCSGHTCSAHSSPHHEEFSSLASCAGQHALCSNFYVDEQNDCDHPCHCSHFYAKEIPSLPPKREGVLLVPSGYGMSDFINEITFPKIHATFWLPPPKQARCYGQTLLRSFCVSLT